MNDLKEILEKQLAAVKEQLKNIYLPYETALILSGKRAAFEIALETLIPELKESEDESHEWGRGGSEMKAREEIAASCPIGADLNSYLIGYANGFTDSQPEDAFFDAASDLVDAVERYMRQECLRSELMLKKDKLKALLHE